MNLVLNIAHSWISEVKNEHVYRFQSEYDLSPFREETWHAPFPSERDAEQRHFERVFIAQRKKIAIHELLR